MAKKYVEITGLNELLKKVDALGEKAESIKKEVLFEAGKELQNELKKAASMLDDGKWTAENKKYGTLESNIWLEWDEKNQQTYISTGNAYWAQYIEFGSRTVTPKPFLNETLKRHEKAYMKIIADELRKRLGL